MVVSFSADREDIGGGDKFHDPGCVTSECLASKIKKDKKDKKVNCCTPNLLVSSARLFHERHRMSVVGRGLDQVAVVLDSVFGAGGLRMAKTDSCRNVADSIPGHNTNIAGSISGHNRNVAGSIPGQEYFRGHRSASPARARQVPASDN